MDDFCSARNIADRRDLKRAVSEFIKIQHGYTT